MADDGGIIYFSFQRISNGFQGLVRILHEWLSNRIWIGIGFEKVEVD
jgi:hypothetical protein